VLTYYAPGEHVYEGNWIRNFLDDLQKKHFTGDGGCENLAKNVFRIGDTSGYAEGMLNSIGTSQTYRDMMTLFPLRENGYKFRVRLYHSVLSNRLRMG
jgi:hypothetical protein